MRWPAALNGAAGDSSDPLDFSMRNLLHCYPVPMTLSKASGQSCSYPAYSLFRSLNMSENMLAIWVMLVQWPRGI